MGEETIIGPGKQKELGLTVLFFHQRQATLYGEILCGERDETFTEEWGRSIRYMQTRRLSSS